MRPGNTNLPVTSITSRALVGRMSGCTAAILPLRMATSLIPSMPEAGHITRPPRRSWSKVALMDMNDLLYAGRRSLSRHSYKYEAYFVFPYFEKQPSCHGGSLQSGSNCATRADVPRLGEWVAPSKKTSWRSETPAVAVVAKTGISDPAVAPDSRRIIPGGLRQIRCDAAAIQPAFRTRRAENRRSDHIGGGYRT